MSIIFLAPGRFAVSISHVVATKTYPILNQLLIAGSGEDILIGTHICMHCTALYYVLA